MTQQQPPQYAFTPGPGGPDPRSKEWQFDLFSCFGDLKGSCIAFFLPCVLHGQTMARMEDPYRQSYDLLNAECVLWGAIQCCTGFGCVINIIRREEMRKRYGIEGSAVDDLCASYCCLCCALVQQDREVALRAGHTAPITQGYQQQTEVMQMPGVAMQPQPQQQQGLTIDQSAPLHDGQPEPKH